MAKGKKKTGGRQKNNLNKVNKDLRLSITQFLENNFDEVVAEWQKLEGKDKLNFFKDLLNYSAPKLSATLYKADESSNISDETLQSLIKLKNILEKDEKKLNIMDYIIEWKK